MDENQKSLVVHYLTEFIIGSIGLGILAVLLWLRKVEISLQLFSAWIFIFNGVLFANWVWKSETKVWEKSIAGIYFILFICLMDNQYINLFLNAGVIK